MTYMDIGAAILLIAWVALHAIDGDWRVAIGGALLAVSMYVVGYTRRMHSHG